MRTGSVAVILAGLASVALDSGLAHAQAGKPAPAAPKGSAAPPADAAAPEQPAESPKQPPPAGTPPAPKQGAEAPAAPATGQLPEPTEEGAPSPQPAHSGAGQVGIFPIQPGVTTPETTPRAAQKSAEGRAQEVLAEDWWSHARPVFEIHGYFRTRAELFQNFSLGRADAPSTALWPRPLDDVYGTSSGTYGPSLCTPAEAGGPKSLDNPVTNGVQNCHDKTQAGANLRFRLDPELHISDNLRVVSQIDILDDVVMGSTPSGYGFQPGTNGYAVTTRSGYASNGVLDDTIVPPTSGVNSVQDSIRVKRVWAEYTTPVGELRFGRMPDHFGLGMVHNSGDGYDDDYQSTIDRLQFITALKPLDLYLGASWDFPNEGVIIPSSIPGGQSYDAAQLDDVNQWTLLLVRKQSPELTKTALAHNQLVLNGGTYVTLRKQLLANDQAGSSATSGTNVPTSSLESLSAGYARRNAVIWIPDFWLQLRYAKFRFEAEAAAVLGSMDNTDTAPNVTQITRDMERKLRQFGVAMELEQKLVEDRLRLNFNFGWASGDPDAYNTNGSTNNLVPQPGGQVQVNDNTISTFRFNPAYRIDLILHRYLLQRVQGTYYVRPSVEYDFMRKPSGQRLGGGAAVIWSRASEFVQTPGHARDLGVELDGRLYFQSKDGALNDRAERMGGFYAMLEYGVLFPLAGLGYQSQQRLTGAPDTSAAHILRLYLGVLF